MITPDDVRHIAHLSRMNLEDKMLERLTKKLEDILRYIEKLNGLDIKDIQPTTHVLPMKNVFREDNICPSLKQKDVMKISISHQDGSFKVPQVIE